jgi:hypothetical protein
LLGGAALPRRLLANGHDQTKGRCLPDVPFEAMIARYRDGATVSEAQLR